jgi:hypothetical protein
MIQPPSASSPSPRPDSLPPPAAPKRYAFVRSSFATYLGYVEVNPGDGSVDIFEARQIGQWLGHYLLNTLAARGPWPTDVDLGEGPEPSVSLSDPVARVTVFDAVVVIDIAPAAVETFRTFPTRVWTPKTEAAPKGPN